VRITIEKSNFKTKVLCKAAFARQFLFGGPRVLIIKKVSRYASSP
jgi:hypothetical protein